MISERTAALLLASSIRQFDNSGSSRREPVKRHRIGGSIALLILALA